MIKEKRQIKYWIITKDGRSIPFYSLDNFSSIPSTGISRFIVSDSEINDAVRRNRKIINSLERVYRKRKKR